MHAAPRNDLFFISGTCSAWVHVPLKPLLTDLTLALKTLAQNNVVS